MGDDSSSKVIWVIAGLIITCVIIAFGFTIVNKAKSAGGSATASIDKINTNLDESKFTDYDGATVTGSGVVSAMQTLKSESVGIIVYNGNTTNKAYNYGLPLTGVDAATSTGEFNATTDAQGKTTFQTSASGSITTATGTATVAAAMNGAKVASITDGLKMVKNTAMTEYYVNPSSSYTGTVIRSKANGGIIGLVFTKN